MLIPFSSNVLDHWSGSPLVGNISESIKIVPLTQASRICTSMIGRGFATSTIITLGVLCSPLSSVTIRVTIRSPGSVNEYAGSVLLLKVPSGNDQLNETSL